jgi:hypothetical protein
MAQAEMENSVLDDGLEQISRYSHEATGWTMEMSGFDSW